MRMDELVGVVDEMSDGEQINGSQRNREPLLPTNVTNEKNFGGRLSVHSQGYNR